MNFADRFLAECQSRANLMRWEQAQTRALKHYSYTFALLCECIRYKALWGKRNFY